MANYKTFIDISPLVGFHSQILALDQIALVTKKDMPHLEGNDDSGTTIIILKNGTEIPVSDSIRTISARISLTENPQ